MNQQFPGYKMATAVRTPWKPLGDLNFSFSLVSKALNVVLAKHVPHNGCSLRSMPCASHLSTLRCCCRAVSHSQWYTAFRASPPVSHWPHSKELVTPSLNSFPANCMIKFLKHCCPFIIPFLQACLSWKIAERHGVWFIFHSEDRK